MFSQTPKQNSRRTATLWSAALHAAAVAALWMAGEVITAPTIPHYEPREAVLIVPPPPRTHRLRTPQKAEVSRFEVKRSAAKRLPEPIRTETQAPRVETQRAAPILPIEPVVPAPRPMAKPAGFDAVQRTSAPKLDRGPETAAFGAALGKPQPSSTLPSGSVAGFGAAGLATTQSAALATRNGGFGGVEVGHAANRVEQTGSAGFGAAERRLAASPGAKTGPARSQTRPVKILWKPVPQYSGEAVQQRIEGDVVLLVRFLAKGTVETIRVVSGLGYGLDEFALQAAQGIRFEPAVEGDQPVDYTAQVRIRFELAY